MYLSQGAPPQFLTQPADVSLVENQLAHFECRLSPVGDPTMRVEWYHNGRPLSAGSRVRTINDFGYDSGSKEFRILRAYVRHATKRRAFVIIA